MVTIFVIGVGAGLASASCSRSSITGIAARACCCTSLAPLADPDRGARLEPPRRPRRRAAGGLAIGPLDSPIGGLAFAARVALPAWWLAYLALLGRAGGRTARPSGIRSAACWSGSPRSAAHHRSLGDLRSAAATTRPIARRLRARRRRSRARSPGTASAGRDPRQRRRDWRALVVRPAAGQRRVERHALPDAAILWLAGQGRARSPAPAAALARHPGTRPAARRALALLAGLGGRLRPARGFAGAAGARRSRRRFSIAFALQGLAVHPRQLTRGRAGRAASCSARLCRFVIVARPGHPAAARPARRRRRRVRPRAGASPRAARARST